MPSPWISDRIDAVVERLTAEGFARVAEEPAVVLHRRRFQPSRFGNVDAVVSLLAIDGTATAGDVARHEASAIEQAKLHKSWVPRGLGSAVELHPVTFADDADDAAVEAMTAGTPNRWSMLVVPALVHDGGSTVTMYEGRKIWGGAYHSSLRRRLRDWLETAT